MRTLERAGRLALGGILLGAMVVLALLPSPAGAGTRNTRPVPPSIDRTGQTDVTAQLQRFLDRVPSGSVIQFGPGARYRVDGTLAFQNRKRLTVEGNGATIFAGIEGDQDRSQIMILGGSQLVFRNLAVQGAHPSGGVGDEAYREDLAFQHGFQILGAKNVELDRVTVTDVYGDFVYMARIRGGPWARNIWIHDSTFARNGRQGIALTAAEDIVFERNTIGETRRATIDLEPNSSKGGAKNVFIVGNRVGPGRLLFIASHGRGPVDDIVVANNLLNRTMTIDVKASAERRARWWVTGNTAAEGSRKTPIRFQGVDGVLVRANTQAVTGQDEAGVGLVDVCGAVVDGNNFRPSELQASAPSTCDAPISPQAPQPPTISARS